MKQSSCTATSLIIVTVLSLAACGSGDSSGETPLPACGSEPLFSVIPLEEERYVGLVPLGALNPPAHTFPTGHHYFYLYNEPGSDTPLIHPVRLPGDAWVTEVITSEHLSASPPYTDYGMLFKPCEDYEVIFGHLFDISTELHTNISTVTPQCHEYSISGTHYRRCSYRLRFFVNAGTEIGITGGRIGQWALDFGAYDYRQPPLQWVNQARIETYAPKLPYTTCPSEMFTTETRSILESRFSNYNGSIPREAEPLCGQIDQDLPGTAQGLWFIKGTVGLEPAGHHLALVHDHIVPDKPMISMGTSMPSMTGLRSFTPQVSGFINRDFSEVTVGSGTYCYDLLNPPGSSLLLELVTATELLLEHRLGSNCSDLPYSFTGSVVSYVR